MKRFDLPDLASPRVRADPHPLYARLRSEAPVLRTRLSWWIPPVWLISRYDDVSAILKDDERFSNVYKLPWTPRWMRPLYRSILTSDPPDHTRLRALVQKAFTPRVVEQLRPRVEKLCDDLLEDMAARGDVDLVAEYALLIPVTVISELLDIPGEDRPQFSRRTRQIAAASSGALGDMLRSLPSMYGFVRYLRGLIERRRKALGDDLLSGLIRAEEEGDRLDEDEILGMAFLLIVAGHETTMNLIATGTLELIERPDQRRILDSATAIEELLRFTSPTDCASPRIAKEDVRIGGMTIARGDMIIPILGSANRDASRFENPDTLDLARDPNRHLALGFGIHFCLGAPLARLEGEIALTKLFRRFPALRLRVPRESLRWRRALMFRALKELPLSV